jgi:hypothetical protein
MAILEADESGVWLTRPIEAGVGDCLGLLGKIDGGGVLRAFGFIRSDPYDGVYGGVELLGSLNGAGLLPEKRPEDPWLP